MTLSTEKHLIQWWTGALYGFSCSLYCCMDWNQGSWIL